MIAMGPSSSTERSELFEILSSMASVRAESALADWHSGEQNRSTRVPLEASIATELMVKAFLAAHNPALLLPNNPPRDTLLHLTGLSARAVTPLHEVKTIGLKEALDRVSYVLPDFSYDPKQDRDLLLARNSAVHLGSLPDELTVTALRSMVRIRTELGRAVGHYGDG